MEYPQHFPLSLSKVNSPPNCSPIFSSSVRTTIWYSTIQSLMVSPGFQRQDTVLSFHIPSAGSGHQEGL